MSAMLNAARLSLATAEHLEADVDGCPECARDAAECLRDELLLANAQASIAIAEALCEAEEERSEPQAEVNPEEFVDPDPVDIGHLLINGALYRWLL